MSRTSLSPYGDYAEIYLELGYSPLPLPQGQKKSPPSGFTGRDGRIATADDVELWVKERPDGNIALRLPKGVIGIDCDAYKGEKELAHWNKLQAELGELPETSKCSSRHDGISGIRLFRVPEDYIAADMGLAGEVVQFHHRYVVAPPSIHPDTGNEYAWSDVIPLSTDQLPELPGTWQEALRAGSSKSTPRSRSTPNTSPNAMPSGFKPRSIERLLREGIPEGMNQETALRDVAWQLACDGVSRDEAERTYRLIAEKTKLTNPSWPWAYEDFCRHYDRAWQKVSSEAGKENNLTGELTDALLAESFADEVLDGKYCWASGLGWMKWDGKRWSNVPDEAVKEESRQWVKRKTMEAGKAIGNGENIADNLTRAKKWWQIQSKSRIEAITSLSKGIVLRGGEEFDDKPDYLNVGNGIVDLRNGDLLPHDSSFLFTKLTDTNYSPGATHPDWTEALKALPDEVRIWYLARLGQAVTGYPPPDDMLVIQQGIGANGKSTIMSAVQSAIGDYFHVVSHRALFANANVHPTEKMSFKGARVSVLEETPEEGRLDVVSLKTLIGTPEISARKIHQDEVTFKASHSLFINTNYRPLVDQTDYGTWRRLALVVFPYRYVSKVTGPNDRVGDTQLRERLRNGKEQKEAVLASLVSSAVSWYENGKIMPPLPGKVEEDTDKWRKESDLVLSYIEERLVFDANKHVTAKDLLADFNDFLQGRGQYKWSDKTFTQRFGDHEEVSSKRVVKKHMRKSDGLSRSANSFDTETDQYKAWQGVAFQEESTPIDRESWARSKSI